MDRCVWGSAVSAVEHLSSCGETLRTAAAVVAAVVLVVAPEVVELLAEVERCSDSSS